MRRIALRSWYAAPLQLPGLPGCRPAPRAGPGVRVRPRGVERLPARPQGSTRGRAAVCEVGGFVPASHHPGQAHRGTRLARRRVSGRPAAVPPGPGHRLQELLRQPEGQAAGPEGGAAPVQVEERHPPVDPPQHQRLLSPGERHGVRGQGRQPQGQVVTSATGRAHVPDRHPGQLWPVLPQLRRRHRTGYPPRAGDGVRYRPRPVRLRGPVRRPEDRQPPLPAPGREETQTPSAGPVPQGQGIEEPGQGPHQGRTPARQGGGPAPGLPPQGIHTDHPRQPSGVCGRPRGLRPRPHPARQVRARRGMVRVRLHAGVQGGQARPHLRQGGPRFPVLSGLLGLRIPGRPQAPARPGVDVRRVRHRARPRPQRSPQRPLRRTPYRRRRTGGDTKRLAERR